MGARIRGRMVEQGVTARDMARLFGISERTWRYWLSDADNLTVGRLKAIAARLGTTASELIEGR